MAKLTTNTIGSRYASVAALNSNFDLVEAALEKTLSRDGTAPNFMEAPLDLNSNRIINVGRAVEATDAISYEQFLEVLEGSGDITGVVPLTWTFASTGAVSYNIALATTDRVDMFIVSVDGLILSPATYTIDSTNNLISFLNPPTVGQAIVVRLFGKTQDATETSITIRNIKQTFLSSIATNETVFATTVTLEEGAVDVFLNGVKLIENIDYTISGTDVILASTGSVGDTVEIVVYNSIVVASADLLAATTAAASAQASASAASIAAAAAAGSEASVAADAAAAAASALAAATSETNAATSESNAATSASNALTSENNAAASESAAAASESAAAASAASVGFTASSITTFTNKTINLGSNTLSGTTSAFNTALSDDNFVTENATQTVTNKTMAAASNTIEARSGPASSAFSFRNKIINGGFTINQRTYASGAVLVSGSYGHDRWKAGGSGGDYTFTQLASNTTITIASGKSLIQVIEDKNIDATSYVLSWTGTAQARYAVNSVTPSGPYAASPILITGQTAGTVMSIEFNTGTVGKVMLEAGSTATPFYARPYGVELALCQRYYYRIANTGRFGTGYNYSTNLALHIVDFPVVMRVAPSTLEQSGTAAHYSVFYSSTSAACNAVPAHNSASVKKTEVLMSTASSMLAEGASTGNISSASGYLGWSAEL